MRTSPQRTREKSQRQTPAGTSPQRTPQKSPALSPHPKLLGLFRELLPGDSWHRWELAARATFGLTRGLSAEDKAFIAARIGPRPIPSSSVRRVLFLVGRRGGKSRFTAFLAVYAACFRRYTLAPGERGVVMLVAADRLQARVLKRYIEAFLAMSPSLAALVTRRTRDAIDLSNNISIEIHTCSYRTTRG